MRQNGIFAAAALYALDHHFERLSQDHANARRFAELLATSAPVILDLNTVQTNIVVFHLQSNANADAPAIAATAREHGVLVNAFGPTALRAVTHLDVDTAQCENAARILAGLLRN